MSAHLISAATVCPCCRRPIDSGRLLLNAARREVVRGDCMISLSPIGWAVASALVAAGAAGRWLTREDLAEAAWPDADRSPDQWSRALDVHLARLRDDLAPLGVAIERRQGRGWGWRAVALNVPPWIVQEAAE